MLKSVTVRRAKKYNLQKETITLEIDKDVLQWLENKEKSYQSYINTLCRGQGPLNPTYRLKINFQLSYSIKSP